MTLFHIGLIFVFILDNLTIFVRFVFITLFFLLASYEMKKEEGKGDTMKEKDGENKNRK